MDDFASLHVYTFHSCKSGVNPVHLTSACLHLGELQGRQGLKCSLLKVEERPLLGDIMDVEEDATRNKREILKEAEEKENRVGRKEELRYWPTPSF